MAILKFFVVMMVLVAGCYAPDVNDCTVTCTTDNECAADLVCTPQGLCGSTTAACDGNNSTVDGGARMIRLRVSVMGEGKVMIAGGPVCSPREDMGPGDACDLIVPAGPLVLEAQVLGNKPFERWTSIVCAGQGPRCEVNLQLDSNVSAKFK